MIPVIFSFSMTFGYALLFLGHVLVSSALGENDHPRWPEWHPADISEGICRWFWAAFFGLALGGVPVAFYWLHCGDVDWFDWIVFAELVMLGTGYAQMALAASLLHDNLIAANPITVVAAIVRIGWDYLRPAWSRAVVLLWRCWESGACFTDAHDVDGGRGSLGLLGLRALLARWSCSGCSA